MDTIIAVADAVAAAAGTGAAQAALWYHAFVNIPHIDGILFGLLITGGVIVGPHVTKKLSGRIDAPPPGTSPHSDIIEDEQRLLDDILTDVELPAPLAPAPNVPIPYPNTISYSPGKSWNQALTLRQPNPPVQADPTATMCLTVILVAGLYWLIKWCCCGRKNKAAAANDDNDTHKGRPKRNAGVRTTAPAARAPGTSPPNVPVPPSTEMANLRQQLIDANNQVAILQNQVNFRDEETASLCAHVEQAVGSSDSESATSRSSNDSKTRKELKKELKEVYEKYDKGMRQLHMDNVIKVEAAEKEAQDWKNNYKSVVDKLSIMKRETSALEDDKLERPLSDAEKASLQDTHKIKWWDEKNDSILRQRAGVQEELRRMSGLNAELQNQLDAAVLGKPIEGNLYLRNAIKDRDFYKNRVHYYENEESEKVKEMKQQLSDMEQRKSEAINEGSAAKCLLKAMKEKYEPEELGETQSKKQESDAEDDKISGTKSQLKADLNHYKTQSEQWQIQAGINDDNKKTLEAKVKELQEIVIVLQAVHPQNDTSDTDAGSDAARADLLRQLDETKDTIKKLRDAHDKMNEDLEGCNIARHKLPTREQHDDLQRKLHAAEKEIEELKNRVSNSEKDLEKCNMELNEAPSREQLGTTERELADARDTVGDLKNRLKSCDCTQADGSLQEEPKAKSAEAGPATDEASDLRRQFEAVKCELEDYKRRLDDCESFRTELQQQTQSQGAAPDTNAEDRIDELQQKVEELKKELKAKTQSLDGCEDGRKCDIEDLEAERKAKEALQKQIEDSQQQEASQGEQYAELYTEYKKIYGYARGQQPALDAAKEREENLQDEIQHLKIVLDAMQQQCEDAQRAQESVSKELSITVSKLDDCKAEQKRGVEDARHQLEEAEKRYDRLQKELATVQDKREELDKKLKACNDDCGKLRKGEGDGNDKCDRKDLEESEKEIRDLEQQVDRLKKDSKDAEDEIKGLREDAAQCGNTIKELQNQHDQDWECREDVQGQLNNRNAELEHTNNQLTKTKAEVEGLRKELKARQTNLDECEALVRKQQDGDAKYKTTLQKENAELQKEVEELRRRLDNKHGKLSDCGSRSQRQEEQLKEAAAKDQGSATSEVQPEQSGTVRTGVSDSRPAAETEGTSSKGDGAKQDGASGSGQSLDTPSDTSPRSAGISAQANGLTMLQMPFRNSEKTAADLQGMSGHRSAQAKLTLTTSADLQKTLDPTTDEFTPQSGPGSSIAFGMSPKPFRTLQSGTNFSTSRPMYIPPPLRSNGTAPAAPDNAPAGPTGKNTCETCEASFKDSEKWRFKIDHQPRCIAWKEEYGPKKYCKETKNKPVTAFPPHWGGPYTLQPAHDSRWKTIAEEEQDRRLKVQEEASSTPIEGQKSIEELRMFMEDKHAENKAKDQAGNREVGSDEESSEKKGKEKERQEPAEVETTRDDSGNRTTGHDSESGSTNNSKTSEQRWADEDEDDNFSPRIPPEWKTEHAGDEKSDSQADDGKPEDDKTAKERKLIPGPINTQEAGPSSVSSTPVVYDTPTGKSTFDLKGSNPLKLPERRIVSAIEDAASSPAPVNEVSPAPNPLSSLPQNLEITEWALFELRSLCPQDIDEDLKQTIETALSLEVAEAAQHLHKLLGNSEEARGFVTSFNNRRYQAERYRPARLVTQGGMGGRNSYEGRPETRQGPPPLRSLTAPLTVPPTNERFPTQDGPEIGTRPPTGNRPPTRDGPQARDRPTSLTYMPPRPGGVEGVIGTPPDEVGRGRGRGQNGPRGGSSPREPRRGIRDSIHASSQSRNGTPAPSPGPGSQPGTPGQRGRGRRRNDRRGGGGGPRNGTPAPSPRHTSHPGMPFCGQGSRGNNNGGSREQERRPGGRRGDPGTPTASLDDYNHRSGGGGGERGQGRGQDGRGS